MEKLWTGLEMPNADLDCNGVSVCLEAEGILRWLDGSPFTGGDFITHGMNLKQHGTTVCTQATVRNSCSRI